MNNIGDRLRLDRGKCPEKGCEQSGTGKKLRVILFFIMDVQKEVERQKKKPSCYNMDGKIDNMVTEYVVLSEIPVQS